MVEKGGGPRVAIGGKLVILRPRHRGHRGHRLRLPTGKQLRLVRLRVLLWELLVVDRKHAVTRDAGSVPGDRRFHLGTRLLPRLLLRLSQLLRLRPAVRSPRGFSGIDNASCAKTNAAYLLLAGGA